MKERRVRKLAGTEVQRAGKAEVQRLRALDMRHLRRFIELNTEVLGLLRLLLRRLEGLPSVMQEITRTKKCRARQHACHARSPHRFQSYFTHAPPVELFALNAEGNEGGAGVKENIFSVELHQDDVGIEPASVHGG